MCMKYLFPSLHLSECRVNGCKRDFICWPFKGVPIFLADSCLSLAERNPAAFHNQMSGGFLFLTLMLLGYEAQFGHEIPHFSGGASRISTAACESRASPFCVSILRTCLNVIGLFCKSLFIRFLFSWSSVGYPGWLLYILVVLPVLSWEEESIASTHSTIFTRAEDTRQACLCGSWGKRPLAGFCYSRLLKQLYIQF